MRDEEARDDEEHPNAEIRDVPVSIEQPRRERRRKAGGAAQVAEDHRTDREGAQAVQGRHARAGHGGSPIAGGPAVFRLS
jgi:hypothetical protein